MEPWQREYSLCLICEKPVEPELFEWALRQFQRPICSTECRRIDMLRRFACCMKAEVYPCVCAYSFECSEHGIRHIGTHD